MKFFSLGFSGAISTNTHVAQKSVLAVSWGEWCFFLSHIGENTRSDTECNYLPEKVAVKEMLMLGFFGMTDCLSA